MSKIVIKRTVSLEFLGPDYAEAYLVFRSIPVSDYEDIMKELPSINSRLARLVEKADKHDLTEQENAELVELQKANAEENKKSFDLILSYLKKYYIGGKFPNEKGELEDIDSKDELAGLDKEAVLKCFNALTGQDGPKAERQ